MKKTVLILTIALLPLISYSNTIADKDNLDNIDTVKTAQKDLPPKKWEIKNRFIISGEEAYYNSWVLNGFNSLTFSGYYLGKFNYKAEKDRWENSIEMAYGITNQDLNNDGNFNDYKHIQKSDDRFALISTYTRKAFGDWYYNANADFRSQFTETYKGDTLLSANIFAPAYLLVSLGMSYDKNGFTALLSPFGNKTTFVTDSRLEGMYGVPMGKKVFTSFGAYSKFTYTKDIFKNVNLATKLEFFYDYKKTLFKDTWVNWELFINMKVNKYLSAFFNTQMLYDVTASKKVQFRERLGVMMSWDF